MRRPHHPAVPPAAPANVPGEKRPGPGWDTPRREEAGAPGGEGGATLTITSYKHRLVADSEHTNTFVDFEKFKRTHRLLP